MATALTALTLIVFGLAGIGPLNPAYFQPIPVKANGGVMEIVLKPWPEGPALSFKKVPASAASVQPLAPFEPFIPDPLPPPQFQWLCDGGGDMIITLGNGKQVIYGPCFRPDSINRLWALLAPPGPG